MASAASAGRSQIRVSVGQERIWLAEQMFPGSAAYHLPVHWELDGDLDLGALKRTLDFLIERHEVFRTTLHQDEDGIWQQVHAPLVAELIAHDIRATPNSSRAEQGDQYIRDFVRHPFDLAKDPLLRALLIRRDDRRHSFVLNMHHLACDSWSAAILRSEITECYSAFVEGRSPQLPPVRMTYGELSSLLSRPFDGARGPVPAPSLRWPGLPLDFERPRFPSRQGDIVRVTLPFHSIASLESAAVERGSTLFATMLAAFGVQLESWTDCPQFDVVTPVTRRHDPRSERTVGYFADDIPISFDLSQVETFDELATEVAVAVIEAMDSVHRSASATVRKTNAAGGTVSFALDYQDRTSFTMAGLGVREHEIQPNASKYDLAMHVVRKPDSCQLELEYDSDLFRQGTVQRLAHHYAELVQALGDGVGALDALPSAPAADVARVLRIGKGGQARTPHTGSSLPECVATIVRRSPELVAAREPGKVLDYSTLWTAAAALGRSLARLGVGLEDKVGVCLPRGVELIIAIVGILRSGGCFVPLDPRDPPARRSALLRLAGARALVTNESQDCGDWNGPTLTPHSGTRVGDPAEEAELAGDRPNPDALAYVIHTSGSTGRPKGVMVSHRGLANYVGWAVEEYGLRPGARVPLHTSIAYDMAITSLLAPLVAGGQIELIPDAPDHIHQVRTSLAHFHMLKATPTNLDVLLDGLEADSPGPAVVVVGGEKLDPEQAIRIRRVLPSARLINEYGPTETVVGSTASDVEVRRGSESLVSIGAPIAGTTVRVLNRRMRLSPVGAWGELAVGGTGVSRGYLGNPSLTAARYVPDSFAGDGARLYLTGDIGRWTPSGALELRGRRDGQVKILGYRVEPGEVEGVLAEAPGVLQSAVRIDEHPRPRIVGYVRIASQQLDDVWRHARRHLPAHMVPDALVRLEQIPQTASGKLDYAALPAPKEDLVNAGRPPSTPTQRVIHDVWCDLLGVTAVDPATSFFEAGGTSLLLLKLQYALASAGLTGLTITDLFRYPTIGELAAHVMDAERTSEDAELPDPSFAGVDRRSARLARRERARKRL